MRAWSKLLFVVLLGAPMVATLPPPDAAMAKGIAVISSSGRVRFVSHPFVSPFFPLTNGVLFPNNVFFRSRFGRSSRFFANSPFFANSFGWPFGWDSSQVGWDVPQTEASPRIIVINAAPPQSAAAPPDGKITVETTPAGVQVVRGPGSRHLARY